MRTRPRVRLAPLFAVGLFAAWAAASGLSQDPPGERRPPGPAGEAVSLDDSAQKALKAGLDALAKMQQPSGAWTCKVGYKLNDGYYGQDGEHVGVTSIACMAFMAAGSFPDRGEYAAVVARGLEYVLRCSRIEDGYLTSNGSRMYEHGFATLFLAQVYGMTRRDDVRNVLRRAATLLVQAQSPEGGWRYQPQPIDADLSVTVTCLQGLRAARNVGIAVPVSTIDRAKAYVNACATPWGFKYQSDQVYAQNDVRITVPLTAAGVVSTYSAGDYDSRHIRTGVERIVRDYSRQLHWGKYHYFYGHYYACQAMYQYGGDAWRQYYSWLRSDILRRQRPDGMWADDVGITYATAMACLLLALPTEALPIFQK